MPGLLCATDFSLSADRAAQVAAVLARRLGESLTLIHVVEPPPAMSIEAAAADSLVTTAFRDAAERDLIRTAEAARACGSEVHIETPIGVLDEELFVAATRLDPRMMVIGTHGRRGAARLLLGSFAERTVRAAPCPVLVVPPTGSMKILDWETDERPLRILVAVDPSPATDVTVPWLGNLRGRTPADVTFVRAFNHEREHDRLGLEWPADPFEPDPEVLEALERELRPRLTAMAGRGKTELLLRPTWGRDTGPVEFEVELEPPDFVVVGTNQRRLWGRSIAIELLRSARVPVLCVPASANEVARLPRGTGPVRRVLVTTDFSRLGNSALPVAYRLLAAAGGVIELLHVMDPREADLSEKRCETELRLQALLREMPPPAGVLARPRVTEAASAADAIVKAVHRLDADLVVVASHGRSGVQRAFVGSVAEQVMRRSPRPVVVARG